VRDYRSGGPASPRYYLAAAQNDVPLLSVVARGAERDASRLMQAMRALVPQGQRVAPMAISDRVEQAMRPWRIAALLFALLGSIALALSCVGVYSVTSYITAERTAELAIRSVLGATSAAMIALVLEGAMRSIGLGIVLGVVGAAAGARLLSSLLYGVSPGDPVVYLLAVLALVVVGAIAVLLPAIRVLRLDPSVALRGE